MPGDEKTQAQSDPKEKVWSVFKEHNIFTGTFEDFKKKYNNPKAIDELYNDAKTADLFGGDKFDFYQKYYPEHRESASIDRLHGVFKKNGYEGTEKDFQKEFGTDEGRNKLYNIAKTRDLFGGSQEEFNDKYFPSVAKKKKMEDDFNSRFTPFIQKKNTSSTSQGGESPSVSKEQDNGMLAGMEISDRKPSGTDLGKSNISAAASNKPITEYQKEVADVYKKHGRIAGMLHEAKKVAIESGTAFYGGATSMASETLDAIGAGARKMDEAAHYIGLTKTPPKAQDEYATTQAAASIRDWANKAFPSNPDLQDNVVVSLFRGAPLLIGAALTDNPYSAAAVFGETSFGGTYHEARKNIKDMFDNPDEYIAQRAKTPEEADLLKRNIEKLKATGESPDDLALKPAIIDGSINTALGLPMAGFFNKLNKYSGGAVTKALNSGGAPVLEQMLGATGSEMVKQSAEQAAFMIGVTAASNYNAQQNWDFTRKVADGLENSGFTGAVMGGFMGGMVGYARSRAEKARIGLAEAKTPEEQARLSKEVAIENATVEHLEAKQKEYEESEGKPAKENAEKVKLSEALENPELSEESRRIISQKLESIDEPGKDEGVLKPLIEKQYDQQTEVLENDIKNAPEEAIPEIQKRVDQLKEEKKAAVDEVYPDGIKPKSKPKEEEDALSADLLSIFGNKEKEAEALNNELGKIFTKPESAKPEEVVPTEGVVKEAEQPVEIKPDEVAEKEAALKESTKPEPTMEFLQKNDLRKLKDLEGGVKEHERIKDEFKRLKQIVKCLWE